MSPSEPPPGCALATTRLRMAVRGAVQGVGFRPFVFRLATELKLAGWVLNSPQGVFLEVEGARAELEQFLLRLETEKPPRSFIQSLEASWLDPEGLTGFKIRPSETGGEKVTLVLPDIATCPDCLREIFDPHNRRHRYPFTNCTNCGPRFSIIEALPYDRANTSMKQFVMCSQCQTEYDDPLDRRFHAQPNACQVCGPRLELWDEAGRSLSAHDAALQAAAAALGEGRIVAVKGLGGFHLMVAAHDDAAVRRLRERKRREEKPLALMAPSLDWIKQTCLVSELEERLLRSSEAPIVLLRHQASSIQHPASAIAPPAPSVAPGNPHLGVMLPYTPLHHLLLAELDFAVVATSGNLSDEPICTDERDALQRLGGIADLFLVHDRPIVRHVDDSIVRVMLGRELVMRRARGYAPLPVRLGAATFLSPQPKDGGDKNVAAPTILAVGAHLKNAAALAVGPQVFISQHIGDLETEQSFAAFHRVIDDLQRLYEAKPTVVAADLHPDYLSTKFARVTGLPVIGVQHHYAHVLSCMAENELAPPVFGVSWDGTGLGLDDTSWGGEFLTISETGFQRFAHLRTFRLPGGEQAVKEPRRVALGLLHEMFGDAVFDRIDLAPVRAFRPAELALLRQSLPKRLNAPVTSSMGRLFDAVAGVIGSRQVLRFEGQAAMELEFALDGVETDEAYPLEVVSPSSPSPLVLDWAPMIRAMLEDLQRRTDVPLISAKFHNALAEAIVSLAGRAGHPRVVLSGGCFQNKYLTERAVRRLQAAGFQPYWHQRVPPNDGGIALGQAVAAVRAAEIEKRKCV